MKNRFSIILFLILISILGISATNDEQTISAGNQPQVSVDSKGIIRIAFGSGNRIFCAESNDGGLTFSNPVLVATLPGMHLGMSRGPQLASSAHYSIITAVDKSGDIHWYRLNHSENKWQDMGALNDLKGSAPEGLMNIAAANKDHFYAVWLDIRTGKRNQIYFAALTGKAMHWSMNKLAYQSPDEHVCECCQPHIAVQGSYVAIMFRNWVNGSRDLYLLKSANEGKSFSPAEKLGLDTWKLNGCPMDGGGIVIDQTSSVQTTWQRKGTVYYCRPGQPEIYIGRGRTSSISGAGVNTFIGYQYNDSLKLVQPRNKKMQIIGKGDFLKTAVLPDHHVICVWEQDNKIKFKKV